MTKVKAIEFEGDWYIIPEDKYEEFSRLETEYYQVESQSDRWYDRWYDICDEIYLKFDDYRTGGDLNLIQLYAEIL